MILTKLDKRHVSDQAGYEYSFAGQGISISCEFWERASYLHVIVSQEDWSVNARLPILIVLVLFLYLTFVQTYPCLSQHASSKEDSTGSPIPAIEEYEKEKLAKMSRHIGRRFMTVPTNNPARFYESPDNLERRLRLKREKEGFVVTEVVQNQSGDMNFYKVKFDSGQIGYLSADGSHLEIKIAEGSLLSIPKRESSKKKKVGQSKTLVSQAVELVKNHPTPDGPIEKRMMDEKTKSFLNMKWRYEAKEIGNNKYRVTQHAEERSGPPFLRTWIVDLSTKEVKPENLAAKEMYK